MELTITELQHVIWKQELSAYKIRSSFNIRFDNVGSIADFRFSTHSNIAPLFF